MAGNAKKDDAAEPRGSWFARNTSVGTRLAVTILAVSVVSLLISLAVTLDTTIDGGDELLRNRLQSLQRSKNAQLEAYFGDVGSAVQALASSRMVIDGVQDFADGHRELAALDFDDLRSERDDVAEFYLDEFLPALQSVRGQPVDILQFALGEDSAAYYLQARYLARNSLSLEEKRLLTDAEDDSSWTNTHRDLHPILRAGVDRFGFEDLFLVEPRTRTVVYSTNKDPSFGTSLENGPHSGTALARVVRDVIDDPRAGTLVAADFAIHPPTLDRPNAFVAAPLFEGDALAGVLVVGLPIDEINEVMSRTWEDGGSGATGEAYLVGPDLRMRSDSRAFGEDQAAYLERIAEIGKVSELDRARMAALGTTVLFQNVDSNAVRAAVRGESGYVRSTSYLGEAVYTAYSPLDSTLLDWVLVAEQEQREADEPVTVLVRDSLAVSAVLVVLLTFLVVAWANSFVNPLRAVSAALVRIRRGEADVSVPVRGSQEFRELAVHVDAMVADLDDRKQAVADALDSKVRMLRTLLPEAAAERVGRGDRRLVETVPQATVVVAVIDGIDEVFADRDAGGARDVVHAFVEEADRLAAVNGLERVKTTGDVYYAVCGLGMPYLDHAPRAVTFARQLRDAVTRLAHDQDANVGIAAGINSGSMTTGLIGGARLIYDIWGDTVDAAHQLARVARRGQILVTEETRDRTPSDQIGGAVDGLHGMQAWTIASDTSAGRGE